MEDKNKSSRRKFLDKGLKVGLVSALGAIGLSKITSKLNAKTDKRSREVMELMTTDGTLIEVDTSEVVEVKKTKGHGMQNLIEGDIFKGQNVVVIEDLISTGGSSLKAVEALRENECNVLGMVAIFTYGFDLARKNFEDNKCKLITLSDYESMLNVAVKSDYVSEIDLESLKEWRKNPSKWSPDLQNVKK